MFLLLKHRQVLLEIFSKNYRVRRNLIQSRLTQECGEDLSKQEVDKVLKVRRYPLCQEPGVGGGRRGRVVQGPALLPLLPPGGGEGHVQYRGSPRARHRLRL